MPDSARTGTSRLESDGSPSGTDSSVLSLPSGGHPKTHPGLSSSTTTDIEEEAAGRQQYLETSSGTLENYGTTTSASAAHPIRSESKNQDGHQLKRAPSAATTATLDFPEGGVKGWLVVLGSFCAMLSLFGLINSAAVFESYFSTNQLAGNTPSEIGWIFSLYLFIVFFVGIQVGPVFDRFGARVLVAVGSLLIFLSLLLLSWCNGMCLGLIHFRADYCVKMIC